MEDLKHTSDITQARRRVPLHRRRAMVTALAGCGALVLGGLVTMPAVAQAAPPAYSLSIFASHAVIADWPGSPYAASPSSVATDSSGNVFVTDASNAKIYKITPSQSLSVIGGSGGRGDPTPGPATSSELRNPVGLSVDAKGNIFFADPGMNQIYEITAGGTLSIIAGNGASGREVPGTATASPLNSPTGTAVDSSGNVFIADQFNDVVEKVTPQGVLSVYAGNDNGGSPNPIPGIATQSPLNAPSGLAIDAKNNLFIADSLHNTIDKVTPTGTLSIVAGNGKQGPPVAGPALKSPIYDASNVAVDASGNVYIVDYSNNDIEKVTPAGMLSVIAGTGSRGDPTPGVATASSFDSINGIAVTGSTVFVANSGNTDNPSIVQLSIISAPGAPTAVTATPGNAQASVSFTPPTATGGGPITKYTVTATDKTKASRGGQTATGSTSPVVVPKLRNGDRYTFSVTATGAGGTSPSSTSSAAVTPSAVPSPPTAVTATSRYKGVLISWSPPSSDGGLPILGYVVFAGTTSTGESNQPVAATLASATSTTISGLTPWTSYYFTVQAVNALGPSSFSAEVSASAASNQLNGTNPTLAVNQALYSTNNAYQVVLQTDGNLVVYNVATGAHLFESETNKANKGTLVTLGTDGTLKLTNAKSTLAWAPKAKKGAATSLVLENNGQLDLITRTGTVLWSGTTANSGG